MTISRNSLGGGGHSTEQRLSTGDKLGIFWKWRILRTKRIWKTVVGCVSKPDVYLCIPTVSVGENTGIYYQVLNCSLLVPYKWKCQKIQKFLRSSAK